MTRCASASVLDLGLCYLRHNPEGDQFDPNPRCVCTGRSSALVWFLMGGTLLRGIDPQTSPSKAFHLRRCQSQPRGSHLWVPCVLERVGTKLRPANAGGCDGRRLRPAPVMTRWSAPRHFDRQADLPGRRRLTADPPLTLFRVNSTCSLTLKAGQWIAGSSVTEMPFPLVWDALWLVRPAWTGGGATLRNVVGRTCVTIGPKGLKSCTYTHGPRVKREK